MSHFTVAVFSRSPEEVEELLAPFDEQSEEYYEIEPAPEAPHELSEEFHRSEGKYENFEDFLSSEYGYVIEDGVIGYRCNPNAKWDWYQIGGRWMGSLRLKEGCTGNDGDASWATHPSRIGAEGYCDQALLKDVDLSPDPVEYAEAIRFWEVVVEGSELREGENPSDFHNFWKPEYYIEQYGTKENYAAEQASFSTWAILTPDGEWHEKGDMGWFGISDATAESRTEYQATLENCLGEYLNDSDIWITIVDCHI